MPEDKSMQAEYEKLKIKQTALQYEKMKLMNDAGTRAELLRKLGFSKNEYIMRPTISEPIKINRLYIEKTQ